eukprot:scaffold4317_cov323-Prasinococcus_capsulatus_cf.AAC.6
MSRRRGAAARFCARGRQGIRCCMEAHVATRLQGAAQVVQQAPALALFGLDLLGAVASRGRGGDRGGGGWGRHPQALADEQRGAARAAGHEAHAQAADEQQHLRQENPAAAAAGALLHDHLPALAHPAYPCRKDWLSAAADKPFTRAERLAINMAAVRWHWPLPPLSPHLSAAGSHRPRDHRD